MILLRSGVVEFLASNISHCTAITIKIKNKIGVKAASHRIRLRLTIQLMANGNLHTSSVGRVRVNFLGFDRLPAYLKLF